MNEASNLGKIHSGANGSRHGQSPNLTRSATERFKVLAKHDTTASEAEAGLSREAEDLALSEQVLKASFEGFQRIQDDYARLMEDFQAERTRSETLEKRNTELSDQLRASQRRCKALGEKNTSLEYIHQRLCENFSGSEEVKADNIIDLVRQLKTRLEQLRSELSHKQEEVKRLNLVTKEQRKTFTSARDDLKAVRTELVELRNGKEKLERLLCRRDKACERQLKALQQQARDAVMNAKRVADLALKANSNPANIPPQSISPFPVVSKEEIDKLKRGVKTLKSELASAKSRAQRDSKTIDELSEKLSKMEGSKRGLEGKLSALKTEKAKLAKQSICLNERCASLERELELCYSHKKLLINVDESIASLRASANGEP